VETFTLNRNSLHTAEIEEPIILYETSTTRCVLKGLINDTKNEIHETLSGTIFHQRKNRNSQWEGVESTNLAGLKAGEGVKLTLKSKPLRKLFIGLQKWYAISNEQLQQGEQEFAVGLANEIIKVPKERQQFIEHLLSENYGEEVWIELIASKPDLATRLSYARIQTERNEVLSEFKESLEKDLSEDYWQIFFNDNQWIFGYGLKYYFLTTLTDQPEYGGSNFLGKGKQKCDFLLNSEAEIKFTVIVEIKKPSTNLLAVYRKGEKKGQGYRYRNGAYLLSNELLGGISQVQINCRTWIRNCFNPENNDKLTAENIYTVCPKGILIIGNTGELMGDREKIDTFQSYRNNINNPEIVTFDELYERAKYIVEHIKVDRKENTVPETDDLPF
jgi:hypothetical protein